MLVFVMFGSLLGMLAGVVALRGGQSFDSAFAAYLLVSVVSMLLLPLVCHLFTHVQAPARRMVTDLRARWSNV